MSRPASTGRKVRLNLELREEVRTQLERLQTISGADSMTEVIRRALGLYESLIVLHRDRGQKVLLRDADGGERELLIL